MAAFCRVYAARETYGCVRISERIDSVDVNGGSPSEAKPLSRLDGLNTDLR